MIKTDNIRILVCTSEYPPDYSSGIGNVAYNVVEQLKKLGVECTVCSPNGDIKLGSSRMIEKLGIIGLLHYWHQVSNYFKGKNDDYDVVWLHNPLFLKKNPFQRSLVTIHSTYYGKWIQGLNPMIYNKIASKIEKHCLNKMNKAQFTAVSRRDCDDIKEAGINCKITYIPNGVDIEQFKPSDDKKMLRKKFELPDDDSVILSVGRLVMHKQPYKLINVFSLIKEEMEDVTLVIAGRGELFEPLKKYTMKKDIKNIKFLGFVPDNDLPDLYACSDYFIIASKYEGGEPVLTVAEAMASGLPCIISDIPNLRFIKGAKSGIVVDFNDEKKAAYRIINYLKEDSKLQNHSKNAREYAVKNLDWKIIAQRYLRELGSVLTRL
jgi:glycosyltransferase involved in cell wall biosynthesis